MKTRISIMFIVASALPAYSQSANYKNTETIAGVASQLDYFATAKKDCSAAAPPTVRVITAPKHGLLTIRRGTVTTNKIENCPNLQTPVNVIFYTGNPGYVGPDEVVYEVTDSKGEVSVYNIALTVKEGKKPDIKLPGQPL
jgi:hypothetical protein